MSFQINIAETRKLIEGIKAICSEQQANFLLDLLVTSLQQERTVAVTAGRKQMAEEVAAQKEEVTPDA